MIDRRWTLALAACALTAASNAKGTHVEGHEARIISTGLDQHPAPLQQLHPNRRSAIHSSLPDRLVVTERWRAYGQLAFGIAVSSGSRLVFAHSTASISQYDLGGRRQWLHTGLGAAPAAAPVVLSNGTRVVATRQSVVHGISPLGEPLFKHSVAAGTPAAKAELLPLADGSLLAAFGPAVLWLEATGELRSSAELNDDVVSLVVARAMPIVVTRRGDAWAFTAPLDLERIGSFGGSVTGPVAASSPTRLVATVEGKRVISLDIVSAERERLFGTPNLQAELAVSDGGRVVASTGDGTWHAFDSGGHSILGSAGRGHVAPAPPLIDPRGSVALAPAGRNLMRLGSDSGTLGDAACAAPIAFAPAGGGRFVLACRSGMVFVLKGASVPE